MRVQQMVQIDADERNYVSLAAGDRSRTLAIPPGMGLACVQIGLVGLLAMPASKNVTALP